MKFQFAPGPAPQAAPLEPGNVYLAKGGTTTAYWVCLCMTRGGQAAHMLGLDKEGSVVSTATYNAYVFGNRTLIGTVNLSALQLTIQPIGENHE